MATNKRLIKSNDEAAGGASFNTVVYSGNASTNPITGVGFEPDFVWIKCRTVSGESHWLTDSVRGVQKSLSSNQTIEEQNITNGLVSFDPDGFTLGSYTAFNSTSGGADNMVAWCWKAGGAAVTNTDGTITSQVSANPGAGFSIVSYTANAVSGATVGHGLNKELDFLIVKSTNLTEAWSVYVKDITDTDAKYLRLNETNGIYTTTFPRFIVGNFNSNVFSVGNNNSTNGISGTDKYIAYCFAEVAGFSKFGSYEGTGSAGNFISTSVDGDAGFEPAFVMTKNIDDNATFDRWYIQDAVRGGGKILYANESFAEGNFTSMEFNSNGFTLNTGDTGINEINKTYIYMAFANQF